MRDLADGAGRCTRLGGVGPLEHFFAALCLLGVQGWILEAQHEDLPLFDGSALAWKEAILSTGERAKALEVAGPLEAVEWSDSRGRIRIEPASALDLEARWSQGPWGGEVWKGGMEDLEQLLMARTFVTAREYLHARESGLLAGAGPESGRLLRGRQIGEEETELARRLGADPQALVWTGAEPRLPGECAAHKALDLVGDWYLRLGGIPRGKILAEDAGHSLHLQIPQRLA